MTEAQIMCTNAPFTAFSNVKKCTAIFYTVLSFFQDVQVCVFLHLNEWNPSDEMPPALADISRPSDLF